MRKLSKKEKLKAIDKAIALAKKHGWCRGSMFEFKWPESGGVKLSKACAVGWLHVAIFPKMAPRDLEFLGNERVTDALERVSFRGGIDFSPIEETIEENDRGGGALVALRKLRKMIDNPKEACK